MSSARCIVCVADVVYDDVILPSLVHVLSRLLSHDAKALIGSVVRNPVTRDQFLLACCQYNSQLFLAVYYQLHQTVWCMYH